MNDAYIYDAVRSPRGKGRADGALHEVTAVALSAQMLDALAARNGLQGHAVEDVIWGNVTQVGEQGGCLARSAVLASGLDESIPGLSINRFCASGMEAVNLAANQVRAGAGRAYIAGGVEMMGRVPMGSDGAAIAVDPASGDEDLFRAAGHFGRYHRHRIRLQSRRCRCTGRGKPAAGGGGLDGRAVQPVGHSHHRPQRIADTGDRRIHAPRHRHAGPGCAEARLQGNGRGHARFRQGRADEIPASGADQPHPPRRQLAAASSTGRRRS